MSNFLPRLLVCALMLAAASAVSVASPDPDPTSAAGIEKMLRDSGMLPADARLIYRDEKDAPLSAEQFAARVKAGSSFDIRKDEKAHTAMLTLTGAAKAQADVSEVTQLPPLDLHDLYNRRIRNLDLAGRPTLISFFFETCVPCIKEAPVLATYRRRHAEFNYLAVTADDAATARRFVQQRNFDWPVAYDAQPFIDAMRVRGFPTYVLVSADGRILGRHSGMDARDMADPNRALGAFEKWVSSRLGTRD